MPKVYTANPYQPAQLGSMGRGQYLLIRQHKFPDTYDEGEQHLTADSDRCFQWDHDHASRCFKEHTGTGDMGLERWVRSAGQERVLKFLVDILKVDTSVKWTGFRVMGTVNQSNGYVVWTLELFAKRRGSKTKVYSSERAPNVKDGGMPFRGIKVDPYAY